MHLVKKAIALTNKILMPARAEHAHRVASLLTNPTHEELAAAYLHDVLEDTKYEKERLLEQFGEKVTMWVCALTNPPDMKYTAIRDFSHLKGACTEVKKIKLADRIDNIKKRVYGEHYNYCYAYVKETENLLEIIEDGDAQLAILLRNLIEKLRQKCDRYEHENLLQVPRN